MYSLVRVTAATYHLRERTSCRQRARKAKQIDCTGKILICRDQMSLFKTRLLTFLKGLFAFMVARLSVRGHWMDVREI